MMKITGLLLSLILLSSCSNGAGNKTRNNAETIDSKKITVNENHVASNKDDPSPKLEVAKTITGDSKTPASIQAPAKQSLHLRTVPASFLNDLTGNSLYILVFEFKIADSTGASLRASSILAKCDEKIAVSQSQFLDSEESDSIHRMTLIIDTK
ncbi:MAG: hypothetical protein NTX25_04535, partial [Proteobacteria bacterium]|nr:hypothetical protein [Pseudomonadota bacterium]